MGVGSFGGQESTGLMGIQDKGEARCGRDVSVETLEEQEGYYVIILV